MTALSKAMSKAEVATSLSGTKLKKVLDDTGLSLHDLTLMQKNNKMDFNKLANSLNMTSTELANLANAGNDLKYFAEISGMTAEEFTKAWEEDASGALIKFIQGLGDTSNASEGAVVMLTEMGITEVRLRDSLIRAANANELFNKAIGDSSTAWSENTALVTEAERRYETVESQMQMAKNELIKVGIAIYDKFRGPLVKALDSGRSSLRNFGKQLQSKEMTEAIETIAEGIGNFVQKSIELATKVIPKLLGVMAKLIKNWDKIKPLIVGATTALLAYKVLNSKVITGMTTGNALMKVGSTIWGVLTGKIKLATVAQKLFNVAQAATPWGLVAVGIGAVVAATIALKDAKEKVSEETQKELEEMDKEIAALEEIGEARDEETEKIREREKAEEEAISTGLGEMDYYEKLWEELNNITDANGKVQEGYETRAKFIASTLNDALGTEIELNGNIIKSYQDLQKEMDKTFQKKKAQIILDAKEEGFSEAIKNIDSASEKRTSDKTTYDEAITEKDKYNKETIARLNELNEAQEKYNNLVERGGSNKDLITAKHELNEARREYDESLKLMNKQGEKVRKAEENYKKSEAAYQKYAQAKAEYEVLGGMMVEEDYEGITNWYSGRIADVTKANGKELLTATKGYIDNVKSYKKLLAEATAENNVKLMEKYKKELETQNKELLRVVDGLKAQIPAKLEDMTPDMKQAWIELATNSRDVYIGVIDDLPPAQRYIIQEVTGVIGTEGIYVKDAWATIASDSLSEFTGKNVEFKDAGNGMVQMAVDGINIGKPMATKTAETLANDIVKKLEDGEIDAKEAGEMLLKGVQTGLSSETIQNSIFGKIGKFASNVVEKLRKAWNEHSPSKVSQGIAEYFMEGISKGFENKENPILKQIRNFGNEVTTSLQGGLNKNDLTNKVGNLRNELNSTLQEKLGDIRANVNGTVSLGANTASLNEIGQIQSTGGKTVIINQTNNSPKSLDRLEIWRQTHNAANLAARS